MAKKNVKWIIGGTVIAGTIAALATLNLGNNLVYFYTPAEAKAQATTLTEKNIKIGGMVKPGTVDWKADVLSLKFTMTDTQGNDIQVSYTGTPPDMFKEGQGVVVEGRLDNTGQTMTGKTLMVKHSEEYKKPGDHSEMNKALLEKSLFKE